MELQSWLRARGGIAHRAELTEAGFSTKRIARGDVQCIGRRWVATDAVAPALRAAASIGGRLACLSAAQHLGLQLLRDDGRTHVAVRPHRGVIAPSDIRIHRSVPFAEAGRYALVESVPDLLAHVAGCLPYEEALIVWESVLRRELLTSNELRRLPWRTSVARRLATEASPGSDSLLETLLGHAVRAAGLPFVQQPKLLGHHVDFLVAGRVVVQADGYAFHSDARQRRLDLEHDARLRLAGFEVVRFAYQDIVHRIGHVIGTIRRLVAIAAPPDLAYWASN